MQYKLDIYERNAKNFKKGGSLSKRAQTADGSYTDIQPDGTKREKINLLEYLARKGYTDIHTGYIDNILYMNKDEHEFVAFQCMKLENWPDYIAIGFSGDVKN